MLIHHSNVTEFNTDSNFIQFFLYITVKNFPKKKRLRTRSRKLKLFFKKRKRSKNNGKRAKMDRPRTHSVTFRTRSWSFRNGMIKNIFCWL